MVTIGCCYSRWFIRRLTRCAEANAQQFGGNTFDVTPAETFSRVLLSGLLASDGRQKAARTEEHHATGSPSTELKLMTQNGQVVTEIRRNAISREDRSNEAADKDHAGSGARDVRLFRNGSLKFGGVMC